MHVWLKKSINHNSPNTKRQQMLTAHISRLTARKVHQDVRKGPNDLYRPEKVHFKSHAYHQKSHRKHTSTMVIKMIGLWKELGRGVKKDQEIEEETSAFE